MLMTIKNMNKQYKKQKVLDDINFEIIQGEILGLVGESGCGKTTLARLIGHFEKPSSGVVLYEDQDIYRMKHEALKNLRRNCQMVFQDNLSSLNPTMKMITVLKEPLDNNFYLSKLEKEEKISRLMKKVDLSEEVLSRLPICISGGERQRVNICRALMMAPQLMICDEITSSLDVITQEKLLKLLKLLNSEIGMSIFFISHDIKAVQNISNRVIIMESGKIVEVLEKEKAFKHSHPYTKKLFEALPINHPSKRKLASAFI